jgi:hypothetical protein
MGAKPKGIGLLSGGLDSAVAAALVRDAGADVSCVHFFTGFCVTGHNSRVGRKNRPIANNALQVAAEVGVPVEMVDIAQDYLPVVLNPKFGYGRNMNPCVDCRVFMLDRAKEYMEKVGGDFVFTGEVLGQRPKSQLKRTMRTVESETGLEGRLLRPLSAQLLPPTIVEAEGRIDRGKLLNIHGRGRKRQIALAKEYGFSRFMQPAGGCCFLTDKTYTKKFKDIITHSDGDGLELEDIFILGVGRHFRFSPDLKVVIGRDETENNFLGQYSSEYWLARANGFAGPTAMVIGGFTGDDLDSIASVVARYSGGKSEPIVEVRFFLGDEVKAIKTTPASDAFVNSYRL